MEKINDFEKILEEYLKKIIDNQNKMKITLAILLERTRKL
jgi:hypothetical protein